MKNVRKHVQKMIRNLHWNVRLKRFHYDANFTFQIVDGIGVECRLNLIFARHPASWNTPNPAVH